MGLNIYGKLAAIQRELKAPKGQYNSFAKYNYRSCEDILEAVKPLCIKNNATLILNDTVCEISGRFYVVATATLADQDGGGVVKADAYAREPQDKKGMDDSQITGMASSYARKYALNGLFCIDDTKDADTDEEKRQEQKPVKKGAMEVIYCQDCGLPITATTKRDGTIWDSADIAKYSAGRLGRTLCAKCIKAAMKKEK